MASLDIAISYIRRGWAPIPIPHKKKRPLLDDWQNLRITEAEAARHFNCADQNIGVQLGPASGGLTDIDLDSQEAALAAPYFLERTAVFGRATNRSSHWLYVTELAASEARATIPFKSAHNPAKMLLEIRIGGGGMGAQTVFPGSTHESGELVTWENDQAPLVIDGDRLRQQAKRLAACTILAQNYPTVGGRHEGALIIGGFLARCGWQTQEIKLFADALAAATLQPPDKRRDMVKAAGDAADGFRRGQNVFGLPKVREVFGEIAAKRCVEWLDYKSQLQETNGFDGGEPFIPVGEPWSGPPRIERRIEVLAFNEITLDTRPNELVKGLMPRRGLALIWGKPKCGKSFATYDLFMHVALGWDYRGRRVRQGAVVYCAPEGGHGFKTRVEAFRQRHLSEQTEDVPFYLVPMPLDLIGERDRLIKAIREKLGAIVPSVVVIDTLNRSLVGSESKDEDMAKYVQASDWIGCAFECLVAIVHHCGINDERPRGHSSLTGAIDAQIAVTRGDDSVIKMAVEYMKDGPAEAVILSKLEVIEIGINDDREVITSCIIVEAKGDTTAKEAGKPTEAQSLARSYLRAFDKLADYAPKEFGFDGKPVAKVKADDIRDALKDAGLLDVDSKGTITAARRNLLWRAKKELFASGVLIEDKGKTWRLK
jgi:hypothetical protein